MDAGDQTLTVTVHVPGSKSITHRALILGARSEGPCVIQGALQSADTDATRDALYSMGFDLSDNGERVVTRPAEPRPVDEPLDLGNSGTSLRLLMAQAALHPWPTKFTGDDSLRKRTVEPLAVALKAGGAKVSANKAPVTVEGPLVSGDYAVDGSQSSQFTSALLMALPFIDGDSTVRVEGTVVSAPYVDLTMEVMEQFGIHIERDADGVHHVPGGQAARGTTITVAPDWSTAAFYLVAGALTEGVHIPGLRTGTGQPDEVIMHVLGDFGLQVEESNRGVTVYPGPITSPGTIDLTDNPDLLPILSILATRAEGTTTFTGCSHVRGKESDRIQAMVDGLSRVGINVHPRTDGLKVPFGTMHGAPVHAFNDHRVHMAFSVASLAADAPIQVDGHRWVNVSHPGFHHQLKRFHAERP